MDQTSQIIATVALIFLLISSAFFSSSETSLMSITKLKLRSMKERGEKGVDALEELTSDQSKLLTSILIGNNIVNIAATSIASALFIEWFGASGVAIATAVMTILVLIFGEITPKTIAQNNPEKVALKVTKPIRILTVVLTPAVFLLNGLLKLLNRNAENNKSTITEEELKTIVDISHEEGVIEVDERDIINNVFEFGDKKAKDAMINRLEVVSIDQTTSYQEIMELFKEHRFSRIPVYDGTLDSVVGILNIKDIIFLSDDEKENFKLTDFIREAFFTYEYKNLSQLLDEMKSQKAQIAVVFNEYGATSGIITMENVLEEIVGDIEDEYESRDQDIIQLSDTEYLINGSTNISDINEELNLNLYSENFDSIGGYIIDYLQSFPNVNDVVVIDDLKFVIVDSHKTKINKIRIIKNNTESLIL